VADQPAVEAEAGERAQAGGTPRGSGGESRGATGRESKGAQPGARGREGQGAGGQGQGSEDLQRLRQEYQRELQRAREALGRLQAGQPRDGTGNATPEQHEFSRSAPGTEAFKQDRSGWESLRRDVDQALERYEAGASRRLAGKDAQARLSAGGSERVPDRYRDLIAKYFESLAGKQSTVGSRQSTIDGRQSTASGRQSTAGGRQSTRGGQQPVKK
jgi:hypothetical protein